MAITPEDFFKLTCIPEEPEEIVLRNAMSRAYYAVYHECLHLASAFGAFLAESDSGAHKKLCMALQKDTRFASIGDSLNRCRLKRHRADYDITLTIGKREAEKAVASCRNLFAEVKKAGQSDFIGAPME